MKDDCIFCKLANGVIPTKSIYEDDDFKCILDASPATKGHALLIPKEHSDNLWDLPDETAGKLLKTAKTVSKRMKDVLGAEGFNLVQNNGVTAGQTVFHFHMHLIPRYADDTVTMGWKPGSLTDEDKAQILDLFE